MSNEFTRTFRVRWSETNAIGRVDLSGYLRYLIETAWDWGATSGLSIAENETLGLVWVIRETEINLFRSLYPNEIFDFKIWLVKWRRVRGVRCFELRLNGDGDLIAQGTQRVVTLDNKTMRPTSPPEDIIIKFQAENPRTLPQRQFPKYQFQPENAYLLQRDVEWSDLDSFEHVNNATYAAFAENALIEAMAALGWPPSRLMNDEFTVINRRFHIQYLAPALWGDRLNIAVYFVELSPTGGSWYIEIKRESDGEIIVQCIIEWVLENRKNGKEQILPEHLFQVLENSIGIVNKHN